MNKILKKIRFDIRDYDIRLWDDDCSIKGKNIYCVLSMYKDELMGFGLQTNLDDNREEKVLKLCLNVRNALKELDEYLDNRVYYYDKR